MDLAFILWYARNSQRHQYLAVLGCLYRVIRLKRIYNFLRSMLILYQLLHVLYTLYSIFMHFLGLTY